MPPPIYTSVAPLVLFAYKRPDELRQTLEALKANYLAAESDLFVFVDGPKNPEDAAQINKVKDLIDNLTGFKSITRQYAEVNKGLAASVIAGVTQIIEQHGRAIVLEDDLVTSANFLDYMNQALNQYQDEKQVFSITGYTFPFERPADYAYDVYFFPRTGSWGWATWKDRWETADWAVSDYASFEASREQRRLFNKGGSDHTRMLRRWKNGKVDSWAIRWCYAQHKAGGLTAYPTASKVQNIGFSGNATNTNVFNRYGTVLDSGQQTEFRFSNSIVAHKQYSKELRRQFSLTHRLVNRLRTFSRHIIS